jgi:imidazolonepropionase-like amidohydrolase
MWIPGLPRSLRVEGGRIVGHGPPEGQRLLVPALIDAHVHLAVAGGTSRVAVARVASQLAAAGVAAALDLGAPERMLPFPGSPLSVVFAGPLMTAPGGYPTRSWGTDGFGLEFRGEAEAREAVARLAAIGARFVKLSFDPRYPVLDAAVARAAAAEAHARGLLVAAHALEAISVRRALDAGCDVLAHTPREELPPELLGRMRGKWVISTLRAFGVAPARLRTLREAGVRVAYGTDLGNQGTAPRIDADELALLAEAGVDPLEAATVRAAELLGLDGLGSLEVGARASVLAVDDLRPASLAEPLQVWIDGDEIRRA